VGTAIPGLAFLLRNFEAADFSLCPPYEIGKARALFLDSFYAATCSASRSGQLQVPGCAPVE
jgi:hypothetical protein